MKSGLSTRVNRMMRKSRRRTGQVLFDLITRALIIFLCIYITGHCISIISGKDIKENVSKIGNKSAKKIVQTVIDKENSVEEHMQEAKEESDVSNILSEKFLTSAISAYINEYGEAQKVDGKEEKTEDIGIIASNLTAKVDAENAAAASSTSSEAETEEVTRIEDKTKKAEPVVEAFKGKIIVPMPKLTGIKYTAQNLKSFDNVVKKFYTITSSTCLKQSDLQIEKALNMNFKIKGKSNKPQILIYHTHSQEDFRNSKAGDKSTTIIGVGDYLAKILEEQFGYNVMHDKSTYDLVNGKLDRNIAYEQAREGVSKILKENPSIDLVLDIHRDGINENTHLVTNINGKTTAQIMFFNGVSRFKNSGDIGYLYNPYLKENLALSLQMKVAAEAYYPGFTRRNYINAYKYNLDLSDKCMLIEMGAQTNTYQEVKNAAEPLAVLVDKVCGGK